MKQQENEREGKAIQALRRALELEPTHLPSWLALAVSHTNEGNRHGTYEAIREWVNHNVRYRDAIAAFRVAHPEREDASQPERFNRMIDCLITMARSDQSGVVDADIQIALAVLMNTNEVRPSAWRMFMDIGAYVLSRHQAYEKAKDCFTTALAVRPDVGDIASPDVWHRIDASRRIGSCTTAWVPPWRIVAARPRRWSTITAL